MVPVPRQKQVGAKKATSSLCHPGLQDWRGLRGEKAWGGAMAGGTFKPFHTFGTKAKFWMLDILLSGRGGCGECRSLL